jgi:hypothetical protein
MHIGVCLCHVYVYVIDNYIPSILCVWINLRIIIGSSHVACWSYNYQIRHTCSIKSTNIMNSSRRNIEYQFHQYFPDRIKPINKNKIISPCTEKKKSEYISIISVYWVQTCLGPYINVSHIWHTRIFLTEIYMQISCRSRTTNFMSAKMLPW